MTGLMASRVVDTVGVYSQDSDLDCEPPESLVSSGSELIVER